MKISLKCEVILLRMLALACARRLARG